MTTNVPSKFGKYTQISKIGAGSFGDVYRATDSQLHRLVVLKFLKSTFMADLEAVRRFEAEARRAARINHPNVVTIHENVLTPDGTSYIVMEYVDGPSLIQLLEGQPHGQLSPSRAGAIFMDVCAGLEAVHSTGQLHRDIKPSNILLTKDGRAKLSDFGLAAALDTDFFPTKSRQYVLGTAGFMAPEVEEKGEYSKQSDIYALGEVLYLMLAGQRRHYGDPPLHQLNPQLPPAVTAVVDRAMARQPSQRYASAGEMAAALKQALRQPISTSTVKKSRRGALTFVLLAAIGLLIAAIITMPRLLGDTTASTVNTPVVAQRDAGALDGAAVAVAEATRVQEDLNATRTAEAVPMPLAGAEATPSPAVSPTHAGTPTPTGTPSPIPTATATPSSTPSWTPTHTPSATPTSTPTRTYTPTPRPSPAITGTPAPSPEAVIAPENAAQIAELARWNIGVRARNLVSYSPDGRMLAIANANTVDCYDLAILAKTYSVTVDDPISALAFSPDGSAMALGAGRAVRIWHLGDDIARRVQAEQGGVNDVAFSPNGELVASISDRIYLWQATDGMLVRSFGTGGTGRGYTLEFSPDGSTLLASASPVSAIWNVNDGSKIRDLEPSGITNIKLSHDGETIAGTYNGPVLLLRNNDGSQISTVLPSGYDINFTPDDQIIAISAGNQISLARLSDGLVLRTITLPGGETAIDLMFSPDGTTLLTAGYSIRFWAVPNQ